MKVIVKEYRIEEPDDNYELHQTINNAIKYLTPRERAVIEMRYGLDEFGYEHTLEEIANIFEVTRNRIMQIEKKALWSMKNRNTSLNDYFRYELNLRRKS